MSLSCEYTHFLGLAAPLRAPLTRRRWDRGSDGEKSGLFLAKSSALSLKRSPFSLPRSAVFSPPLRSFSSVVASLLSAVELFVSAVVRAATTTRSSSPRARYAHSASFRFSAFTSSLLAYRRLIYRWLRVKDSPRKRVLNVFVIICRTVCCV